MLFRSGEWTVRSGTRETSGQLDDATLATIESELANATWKVETSPIGCFARSAASTDYFAYGKKVFTARVCSPERLDWASQHAVSDIERTLTERAKKAS